LRLWLAAVVAGGIAVVWTASALGELPGWIRNIEGKGPLEAVFFRKMTMPGGVVDFRRPPAETRPALSDLIKSQPRQAELYSLRALEDEQQLDFKAAEADWKSYVQAKQSAPDANLALADFYHRRSRPLDEIATLSVVAGARAVAGDKLVAVSQQRSWQAFERIFAIVQEQGLSKDVAMTQYGAWIARYPQEPSLYARYLQFLVAQKEYGAAGQLIGEYRKQFPNDAIFPVRAKAMIAYRQGSVHEGLAAYEQTFEPLWDPELVKSYFDLLRETQSLRKFLDQARASLAANPADLNATARLFYYYQQQGKLEAAQQAIADLRAYKDSHHAAWTSQELYVCARLLEDIHAYPESARYYFALYNSQGMADAQERGLTGLADVLLTAPETPIRLGTGDLSMYRDIATLDSGPGYWNGILSLLLNTTQPAAQYSEEERRAVPYFHRAQAARLLALVDARFPNSAQRAELHAKLLEFYAGAAESDAVIQGGREFLAAFPKAPQRTAIALLMADAYARKGDTANEFAIYDSVLQELAAQARNVPLGEALSEAGGTGDRLEYRSSGSGNEKEEDASGAREDEGRAMQEQRAFQAGSTAAPVAQESARSPEYARVLERYLARLVEMEQIPQALGVLRREIDRNPDDPGLYERLATFLAQNRLGSEQEEVYRRAMARFSDRSWYDKLARFYLREKRRAEFEQLTRQAVDTFTGTELESYFQDVVGGGMPVLYLRLNQYAHERFPHNPVFVQNLLYAYQTRETWNPAAWEALLRQHWFEEASLRNQFFAFLSRTNRLEDELAALRESTPDAGAWKKNPAAADFLANAELWRSHFEESAPVLATLAAQYPADFELGRTASSVYRSLAYFQPEDTAIAAGIEDRLLQVNPGDTQILARIGDIYADRDRFREAAPYWNRIPQVKPGESGGYLEAATIFWDYYDFDNAVRLLREGRQRLGDPTLYAFEMGAIYENERDYPNAVAEYVKGALGGTESAAENRLLQLAPRPKLRAVVDQATANIAEPPNPSLAAVNLRVRVLDVQDRKAEIEPFLNAIVDRTTSIELAESLESLAQQRSLELVRQHALEKQASLTSDPVARLQIRYALVRVYEGRKDFAAAQKDIDALYRENPKILGVVRSTVDFYWSQKNYARAIDLLLQAAKDSYPELGRQFTFEAARKATEAKQYAEARDLLSPLLKDAPYNGDYLAAMADTYAQAGDDAGLRQFYDEKIAALQNAPLPAETRKAQIATLRRGLIPALTRLKQYAGAVDQYIELVNKFPEDEGLVTEAALYAQKYQRQSQLLGFYAKTVAQSPRDYRWSMVLARMQTTLEDYPAAIATYAKAIAVRPDRVDLYTGRAGLEERLMRFDEAAADYEKIYQLAYKDPQWMEKVAEVRARQGRTADVVAALQAALITGRPESANGYREVAQRLEGWGMLNEAQTFAKRAVEIAGDDLLATPEDHGVANQYVRVMTRLRRHDEAYAILQKEMEAASSNLPVLKEQIAKQGLSGISDEKWREHVRQMRIEAAHQGMTGALQEMGRAVNSYFTPEERLNFARFAEGKRSGMSSEELARLAIPLAESAGLADQEAHWRFDRLTQLPFRAQGYSELQPLVDLQRRRTRFAELGAQLEQLARPAVGTDRNPFLIPAADAYRSAGDPDGEVRVLSAISASYLDDARQQRLFELLLQRQPERLVALTSNWQTGAGERAADYVIAHGDATLAHSAVQTRGRPRPPVWTKSYDGLVGLYFSEPAPGVNNAFVAALGDETIGKRLAKPVDRSEQLAGSTWFYYGSRYGEYLGVTRRGGAEKFLPAVLEESPATPSGYRTLADYYVGSGDSERAIAEYNHTLDLAPGRPDVLDDLAVAFEKRGDHTAAIEQWRSAFRALAAQVNAAHPSESFWRDFGRTCDQLRARHLFRALQPEADAVIRAYLRHNGNYRSNALLQPAYAAVDDPNTATAWLLDLSTAAHDPTQILVDVANASWIPLAARAPIYQRILQAKQHALEKASGVDRDYAQQNLDQWQVNWIRYLVRAKQYDEAAETLRRLSEQTLAAQQQSIVPLDLLVSARLGTLDSRIAAYQSDPQKAPDSNLLRAAAKQLRDAGDPQSARKIMEFVFAREIDNHQLNAANFLGLADLRLASGDTAGALDLLRRLVAVVGQPFENLDPAAALLEKTGHNAEAIEFLEKLVQSAPWDPSYRLRLAKARLAVGREGAVSQDALSRVASDSKVAYRTRVQAATALAGRAHDDLGSGELNLLAGDPKQVPASEADKFYFYEARIAAAPGVTEARARMELLSHCVIDFPRRDEARVPLFDAAIRAQSDEYALGAVEPVLGSQTGRGSVENEAPEEPASAASEDDEGSAENAAIPEAVRNGRLSRVQQTRVERMAGEALLRLNRPADALPHFQTARRLESDTAERTKLSREIQEIRAVLRMQNQNASRRPVLHEALEQDRIVRPRIVARSVSAETTKKGGAKL
jgi:tetratricopeptide (TPR) repeat protein